MAATSTVATNRAARGRANELFVQRQVRGVGIGPISTPAKESMRQHVFSTQGDQHYLSEVFDLPPARGYGKWW